MRSILTVDNEKSLCEKKKSPFEIIDWLFSEPVRHIQSAESILAGGFLLSCGQYKTRTADYGLRTTDCGLGIKHGLGIKRELSITDWV